MDKQLISFHMKNMPRSFLEIIVIETGLSDFHKINLVEINFAK